MAAIVKFIRPNGEVMYVNADHVVAIMEAPADRATLHLASDRFQSVEVDTPPYAVAELLTSAASGFVVNNAYVAADDPAALEQGLAEAAKEGAPPGGE